MKPHETPESSSIALAEEVSQLVSSGVLDKDFVGYLKFAIEEERNRIMKKNRAENVVVGGAGGEDGTKRRKALPSRWRKKSLNL